MINDRCELYLSKDIMQGEEVPFYVLWDRNDVLKIKFEFSGFEKITELHNVNENVDLSRYEIDVSDLKTKNYFGGVLNTTFSDDPFLPANLKVSLDLSDGSTVLLEESRILYATILEISKLPDIIDIPFATKPIEIKLKGSTTVFIDIKPDDGSEIEFELPKEIQNAIEKFIASLIEGLSKLKEKYPEYCTVLDILLEGLQNPDRMSERQFVDNAEYELEKFDPTKEFIESFAIVMNNAFHSHTSLKDAFFRPLLEYFEASAADKGFLKSPFMCLNVNRGRSLLKGKIYYENILEKEGIIEKNLSDGVPFETVIECTQAGMIPLKELIDIRRTEYD